jgi:hypothetical protein
MYPEGRLDRAYDHINADKRVPILTGDMLKASAITVFAILRVDLSK